MKYNRAKKNMITVCIIYLKLCLLLRYVCRIFNIKRQTLIETLISVTVSNFVRLTVYKN